MRFLHLEDNPADAQLVREFLLAEWPDCEVVATDNRGGFAEQLESGGAFEIILSDFNLGAFDGLEALALSRRLAPRTPFIFLSGTIGEDRAIAAVRAGAHDYVLKERIKQLVPAIRRALRDREELARRREAEEAQRRFVALLEHTPDLVGLAALNGHLFYLNRAGRRMLRLPENTDPGLFTIEDFHPPEVMRMIQQQALAEAVRHGTWSGETTLLTRDGTLVPVSQVIIAHKSADDTPEFYSTVIRDISAAKVAERRIREQADLINKARDAIVVSDLAGRITLWNQGAERIFGWSEEEVRGRRWAELFGEAGSAAESRTDDSRSDAEVRSKDGRRLVIDRRLTVIRDEAGKPVSHLSICTDITERKQLEDQFLRAQRLESIGMLAAGIAHDLNNVLAPILMAAPMLRERTTHPGDLKLIAAMEKSAERGAGLVRQILGFAQGAGGEHRPLQIKHLIREIADVIGETFPKNIRLATHCPNDLWLIKANPTQIHQVILNLSVNARDAMPAGGDLRLSASNALLDEAAAVALEGGRAGAYVRLEVADTGTGMTPEILARIWEPFFTTKGAGQGTGLGLPTVRGIVQSHNGFMSLATTPGRGTTFQIHLPAEHTVLGAEPGRHPVELPRGQGELVLVVDDEGGVRDLATAILMRHGYRVLAAESGLDALALFVPRSQEISLIVTDLNMPALDGLAFSGIIRRLNPATRILMMSGMDPAAAPGKLGPPKDAPFLPKPFSVPALLTAVHRTMHPDELPGASPER
jgi:two-component system cell cycle sensor histidine kinase/response regulator CckA